MRREQLLHDGMRMPHWMRRWVYVATTLCLASGLLWLIFHHYIPSEGPFGPQAHPLEHTWLVVHGAAALLMTWVFGLIWLAHVRRGWPRRRNRNSGSVMAGGMIVLIVTGWGLYYLGDESWRATTSLLHWGLGLGLAVWLPIHIWRGRRSALAAAIGKDPPL